MANATGTAEALTKAPETRSTVVVVPPDIRRPRAVVMRPLASVPPRVPGEVIEVETRRRTVLVRTRQLRELVYGEQIYRCTCGRMWVDEEQAKHHGCAG